jgi:hypothetical protein
MKKALFGALMSGALLMATGAQAAPVNVGGVIWDPATVANFFLGTQSDFTSNGTVIETALTPALDNFVSGRGKVDYLNSINPNVGSFCPGCELTYTFSMELQALGPSATVPGSLDFLFKNLVVNVYVDNTPNYNAGNSATASDGTLWLSLVGNGFLAGTGTNIGTGSDAGSGSALLDVTGGLAQSYFNTNTKANGADMVFSSSFQPLLINGVPVTENGRPLLTGTFDLTGDTVNVVPEPSTLALLGLSLVGLVGLRKRGKKTS